MPTEQCFYFILFYFLRNSICAVDDVLPWVSFITSIDMNLVIIEIHE